MEPGGSVGGAGNKRRSRRCAGRDGCRRRRGLAVDGVRARREQRALDAVGGDLRSGKRGLLRMRGESSDVRDRVHVPLVLQRQQQQRKHGETDGTKHGKRGFDSRKTKAIVEF